MVLVDVAYERTSFAVREEGKEWVGHGFSIVGDYGRRVPGVDGAARDGRNW